MFKRLKDSLVRSFVGAITLGWIFSQAILHFAYIFSTPIASWLSRRLYADVLTEHGRAVRGFSPQEAIPELLNRLLSYSWGTVCCAGCTSNQLQNLLRI
jgi:hypothetical protein